MPIYFYHYAAALFVILASALCPARSLALSLPYAHRCSRICLYLCCLVNWLCEQWKQQQQQQQQRQQPLRLEPTADADCVSASCSGIVVGCHLIAHRSLVARSIHSHTYTQTQPQLAHTRTHTVTCMFGSLSLRLTPFCFARARPVAARASSSPRRVFAPRSPALSKMPLLGHSQAQTRPVHRHTHSQPTSQPIFQLISGYSKYYLVMAMQMSQPRNGN